VQNGPHKEKQASVHQTRCVLALRARQTNNCTPPRLEADCPSTTSSKSRRCTACSRGQRSWSVRDALVLPEQSRRTLGGDDVSDIMMFVASLPVRARAVTFNAYDCDGDGVLDRVRIGGASSCVLMIPSSCTRKL
jgi:hypothetical protein